MNDVFTNVSTNDLLDINGALNYFMFYSMNGVHQTLLVNLVNQTVLNVGMIT